MIISKVLLSLMTVDSQILKGITSCLIDNNCNRPNVIYINGHIKVPKTLKILNLKNIFVSYISYENHIISIKVDRCITSKRVKILNKNKETPIINIWNRKCFIYYICFKVNKMKIDDKKI